MVSFITPTANKNRRTTQNELRQDSALPSFRNLATASLVMLLIVLPALQVARDYNFTPQGVVPSVLASWFAGT